MSEETTQNAVPEIRKTAIFNAPIEKVWEAVATAEGIAAWFMPNDFEQRVGHEFTIQSPFGPSPCKVIELTPPTGLSFSWGETGWRVYFQLRDVEGKTEFTLIHTGWGKPDEVIPGPGQSNLDIRNRMDGGWENIVHEALRKVVEG